MRGGITRRARDAVGGFHTVIPSHHVQTEIDACRASCRGVNIAFILIQHIPRPRRSPDSRLSALNIAPVGGGFLRPFSRPDAARTNTRNR